MAYTRIHRLLKVVSLVQSGRQWNIAALARECETTERTVYRDLNELDAAGIPIRYNQQRGGYEIIGNFFMPPVHLTGEEALALAALCEHIGQNEQIPLLRPAWRALHKVESQLPESVQRDLAQHSARVSIKTAAAMPPDGYADVYERVQHAIATRHAMRCCYESPADDGENSPHEDFEFHPYTLLFSVRAWYVLGYHAGRDDLRCLKLNRFTKAEATDRAYDIPDAFSVDDYLGNAWRMIGGEDVEVELQFDAEFAQTISDTRWHRTQDIRWHEDDSCTFVCTVSGFAEIEWWILSMGPHCIVKRPAELARRVRDLAAATAAQYA